MKNKVYTYGRCSDGDTGEEQMLINLGTKNKTRALKVIDYLINTWNHNGRIISNSKKRGAK